MEWSSADQAQQLQPGYNFRLVGIFECGQGLVALFAPLPPSRLASIGRAQDVLRHTCMVLAILKTSLSLSICVIVETVLGASSLCIGPSWRQW